MKDHYDKSGGMYELSEETKEELGLLEAENYNKNHLTAIQIKVVEPLLMYW